MGEHGKVMSKRYQKLNATKRQTFFHYHSKVLFNVFLVTSTSFRVIFFVYSKLLTFDVCLWIKAKQVVCKWGFLEGCGYGLETFVESSTRKHFVQCKIWFKKEWCRGKWGMSFRGFSVKYLCLVDSMVWQIRDRHFVETHCHRKRRQIHA